MTNPDIQDARRRDAWAQPVADEVRQEVLKLSEALLFCQRELAQVREAQEPLMEECSGLLAESAGARQVSAYLAAGLAGQLSRNYWEEREPRSPIPWRRFLASRWPLLRRVFQKWKTSAGRAELEHVRLIEASDLFQADWYLQQHADVALAGINPATHYLQCGAREGRDPGPEFNTRDYLAEHPDCENSGVNPLIHYLRRQGAQA